MRKIEAKKRMKTTVKILIIFLASIFLFLLYQIYQSIEVNKTPQYSATKTLYTEGSQTVEQSEEKSQTISSMIEETTKKVVGISKLKNTGTTLLSNASEKDLGLGSRSNSSTKWIYIK